MFLGAGVGKYGLSYSSDNDLSYLEVDADGQIAKFVDETLRVCSALVVQTY